MSTTVRTVIVDDHALVGAGMEAVLAEQSGGLFEVVGTTTRAAEAAAVATAADAHLALVDLRMPPPGGLEAIRQIREALPACKVVALSGEATGEQIIEALAHGAVAFLPKTLGPQGLVAPLRTVVDGGAVAPAGMIGEMAARWWRLREAPEAPALDEDDERLLALLCQGLEVSVIAERMHVSLSTVKRRLSALEDRFGVSSRLEMAHLAGWFRIVRPGTTEVE